jgi:hypothetical protein
MYLVKCFIASMCSFSTAKTLSPPQSEISPPPVGAEMITEPRRRSRPIPIPNHRLAPISTPAPTPRIPFPKLVTKDIGGKLIPINELYEDFEDECECEDDEDEEWVITRPLLRSDHQE